MLFTIESVRRKNSHDNIYHILLKSHYNFMSKIHRNKIYTNAIINIKIDLSNWLIDCNWVAILKFAIRARANREPHRMSFDRCPSIYSPSGNPETVSKLSVDYHSREVRHRTRTLIIRSIRMTRAVSRATSRSVRNTNIPSMHTH